MDRKTQLIQEQDSSTGDTTGPVAAVPTGPKIVPKRQKAIKMRPRSKIGWEEVMQDVYDGQGKQFVKIMKYVITIVKIIC